LLVTGALVTVAMLVKRHYKQTEVMLQRLDILVKAAQNSMSLPPSRSKPTMVTADPKGKTAIVLVNGFNGLGLHTLHGIIQLFGEGMNNLSSSRSGLSMPMSSRARRRCISFRSASMAICQSMSNT